MREKLKGYLLLGTALVTCPCHLPIALVLLAGTSLGGFLSDNFWLVAIGLTGYFVLTLSLGMRLLKTAEGQSNNAPSVIAGNSAIDCKTCREPDLLASARPNEVQQHGQRVRYGNSEG